MFPDALCTALSHLHSNAPAHSWAITQDTVEQALSIPRGRLLSVFDSFEPQPIASGSIAQVHRATLRHPDNSGQNNTIPTLVAVKVRHPKVQLLIDMDFRIMSFLAQIVDAVPSLSWIQLRPSIEQFSHTMAAQAHLNVEAHHLEVLNYNFRHWDTVGFPKPLFASSSVIVETFERGDTCTSILDFYDRVAAEFLSPQEGQSPDTWRNNNRIIPVALGHTVIPVQLAKFIVTSGVSLYLKMLLVDNLMHADLHPGKVPSTYPSMSV
jgi:aarF domain-containing kinase